MFENRIKNVIRTIPNFPKKGIMFRDITTLLSDKKIFNEVVDYIASIAKKNKISKIIGIESRGFLFAAPVAYKNNIPLVLIRKKGKLPGDTYKAKYNLEYGNDQMEINKDSIKKNDTVMIVDDIIATGGTALAASKLVRNTNSKIIDFVFLIELKGMPGISKIQKLGDCCTALSSFSEDES
tara:strand:+ start:1309 stop:1851 length:543 start_codon:yes stop_codon:yes gene_type:complete